MYKQTRSIIRNHRIPRFIIENLRLGNCNGFLDMNILNEASTYVFTYDTALYEKLDIKGLDREQQVKLLYSLLIINNDNEEWMVDAKYYRIDSEVIYNRVGCDVYSIRLAFYPDRDENSISEKLLMLMDEMEMNDEGVETGSVKMIRSYLSGGDIYKAMRYIDRLRLRYDAA